MKSSVSKMGYPFFKNCGPVRSHRWPNITSIALGCPPEFGSQTLLLEVPYA